MHTDQIYIARDGKSGMHVLVRILAVDDIRADYPPIDPDNFNKLMMARDVKSLVLAARDLGSMYMSVDSRPRFGGAAHLFELNEDRTQPIVLTRLWDRKTVHK